MDDVLIRSQGLYEHRSPLTVHEINIKLASVEQFSTGDEIDSMETCEQARKNGLTTAELVALKCYTGRLYMKLNKYLRKVRMQPTLCSDIPFETANAYTDVAEVVNSALQKKITYSNQIVYRYETLWSGFNDKFQVGEIVQFESFIHTTTIPKGLFKFPQRKDIVYIIHTKYGVNVRKMSKYPAQREVLIQPCRKFKVVSKRHNTELLKKEILEIVLADAE